MDISKDQTQVVLPPVLACVSEFVDIRPEAFIIGDKETRAAALQAAKYAFDLSVQQEQRARPPVSQLVRFAESSSRPQTRSAAKRKRLPPRTDEEIWRPTPLESLHLEGMDVDQVWAQLELRTTGLCDTLKLVFMEETLEDEDDGEGEDNEDGLMTSDEEALEDLEGFDGLEDPGDMREDTDEDDEYEGSEGGNSDEGDDSEDENSLEEGVTDLRDPSDDSEDSEKDLMDLDRPNRKGGRVAPGKPRRGAHPVLDDGFFSLAEFNAETEEAEAKDVSKGRLGQDEDADDDDDADDDVDLYAAVDDVGGNTFEEDDLEDGGEPYYKDFFAAPSRANSTASRKKKASLESPHNTGKVRFHDEVRVKKIKSRGKGNSVSTMRSGIIWEDEGNDEEEVEELDESEDYGENDDDEDEDEGELEEGEDDEETLNEGEGGRKTIERLKDDLFAEDQEAPSKDLSTHETRQAEIAAQISELESKNVAPKEWTLMGEATSRSRPVNSLLEEDLEFERAMKAVPVVTEESVNSLEELIKRRIVDNIFDDVVRKRPVDDKPFLPSRLFELNDQKSTQSLAQIYEDEYTASVNGTSVDDRDGKLKKEHGELEKLWDNICYKLDALSNAHFTPKQPKATISTVSNVAATTLESALPTTKSTTTMLAPEEVFAAPSELRSRDELTPIEKRAHRNKQRKARKREKDHLATTVDKFARAQKGKRTTEAVKREKEKALKSVVKTGKGVTVVGKQSAESKRHGKTKPVVTMDGKRLKL